MTLHKTVLAATAAMLLAGPAFAQTDPHHPDAAPGAAQAQPAPDAKPAAPQAAQPPGSLMGGGPNAGMMGNGPNGGMMGPGMMGGGAGPDMMTGAMMERMMGMMMGMQPGEDGASPMAAAMAQHVEGRIGFIKAELAITEAQTPEWDAFADALRADAKQMMSRMPGMMSGASGQATTAIDRLDARERALTARLDSAKRVSAALKPLYATLTPAQKQKADEILVVMTGM
jgi:hypothetical protein